MNLAQYYKLSYVLRIRHGWDGEYLDNQYPFERQLDIDFLSKDMEKENEKR